MIIIYFFSGFLSKFIDLNKSIIFSDKENDYHDDHSIPNEVTERGFLLKLMNAIRGCLGLVGIYICIVFLVQLIELFKYHYKSLKEKNKNKQKII